MGKTSSAVKNRWNADHYIQIKIAVKPEIAMAFKEACKKDNVSVTGVLSDFMAAYIGKFANSNRPDRCEKNLLTTRPGRRKLLSSLICQLEGIKDAEEAYKDRIPDNLQGSVNYDAAAQSVDEMEEALESLSRVY